MPEQHRKVAPPETSSDSTSEPGETSSQESSVMVEANRAIDNHQLWVARDLLAAHVREERDVDALRLLGEVHHGMGDLPAAGAAWFGAGVKGPEVEAAVAAWREVHGDDFGAMWRSLPRSIRQEPRSKKVEALRGKALEAREAVTEASDPAGSGAGSGPSSQSSASSGGGIDAAQIIAWVIAALVVVCAIVGLVQVLRWMVPGA